MVSQSSVLEVASTVEVVATYVEVLEVSSQSSLVVGRVTEVVSSQSHSSVLVVHEVEEDQVVVQAVDQEVDSSHSSLLEVDAVTEGVVVE